MRATPTCLVLCASVAACGGFTDGGSGSGTLKVVAGVADLTDGDYGVHYNANELRADLEITTADGSAVTDATVKLTDGDTGTEFPLEHDTGNGNGGRYRLRGVTGYHRKLALHVEATNVGTLDAQLEGPGPHIIESPGQNEELKLASIGGSLDLSWSAPDGIRADYAYVAVHTEPDHQNEYERPAEDTGDFTDVPAAVLAPGSWSVSVERFNQVVLDGGLPGSILEIRYIARNEFVIN